MDTTDDLRRRADMAALRLQFALMRMSLRELKYRPDQPRVPAGSSDGGRWMDDDSGAAGFTSPTGDFHLETVANRKVPEAPLDLRQEGSGGRHAIERHVGRTESSLRAEVASRDLHGTAFDDISAIPAGSFDSIDSANHYVNDTIASDPAKVAAVAMGAPKLGIIKRYASPTGYEVIRIPRLFGVVTVKRPTFSVAVFLAHAPGPRGFRIVTAYPMNGAPDADGY